MLLKQKSISKALTILVLLISAKIVNACTTINYNSDFDKIIAENIAENNFYNEIYSFLYFSLIFAIACFYFFSGRRRFWIVISAFASLILQNSLMYSFENSCGRNPYASTLIRTEFVFILFLFILQVILWIIQRSKLKAKLP